MVESAEYLLELTELNCSVGVVVCLKFWKSLVIYRSVVLHTQSNCESYAHLADYEPIKKLEEWKFLEFGIIWVITESGGMRCHLKCNHLYDVDMMAVAADFNYQNRSFV